MRLQGKGMPNVEANGASLFYEQSGTGEPVVFVHGTMSDLRTWKPQVQSISQTHNVIAYSRRFATPNANAGDIMESTVEKNAADLAALLGKLGVAQVHLVGHSYGGFIAAYMAANHPEMLRSVTLNNAFIPTVLLSNSDSPLQQLTLLLRSPSVATSARRGTNESAASMKATESGKPDDAAKLFYAGLFDKGTTAPVLPDEYRKMMTENARTLKETTTPFPKFGEAEAKGIKVPTLVIRGEISAKWDLKISEKLAAAVPGSESVLVRGGGHFCMLENPSEFNSHLSSFLAKHT